MAHLNHKGPDEEGPKTGRKLGLCKKLQAESIQFEPGQGMGMQRRSPDRQSKGKGRRLGAYDWQ